jgi:hypothetical protein
MRRAELLAAAALVLFTCGCAGAPAPAPPSPDSQPYNAGELTVSHPKQGIGSDLCGSLSEAELSALVGRNATVAPPPGGDCVVAGDDGYVFVIIVSFNVDLASRRATSDRPGYRATLSGNSTWVTPSSMGCTVDVAIDPNPAGSALELAGHGSPTCDRLRATAQLVLDRLPPQL